MSEQVLGMCDKRQYEHNGPHQKFGENGQKLPPFPCVNWHPIVVPPISSGTDAVGEPPDYFRIATRIKEKFAMEGATPEDWIYETLAVLESEGKLLAPSLAVDAEVVLPEFPKEVSVFGFGDLYPKEATDEYAAKLLWRIGSQMRDLQQLREQLKAAQVLIEGYKEWADDVKRLSRDIDVSMNGEDAAQQASLCDLVGPIANLVSEIARMKAGGAK